MKIAFIIVFILVLLFLQIGIFPHIRIAGVFPNLIILSILSLIILEGWKKNLVWIIVGGLFLDFYSLNTTIGFSVVSLLIAGYLAYFLSQNIFKKVNIASLLLIFLISIFLYNLIFLIFSDLRFSSFVMGIIYNLIFALPVFYVVKKIQSKKKI